MKRPFSVTILYYLVLSLIAWSILRLIAIISWWRTFQDYSSVLLPFYISVSAVVWLVVGLIVFYGLKSKKAWIQNTLIGTGACYALWYWCDRFFVQWPHANWQFALFATILILIIGMIGINHPKTKLYIQRETHD